MISENSQKQKVETDSDKQSFGRIYDSTKIVCLFNTSMKTSLKMNYQFKLSKAAVAYHHRRVVHETDLVIGSASFPPVGVY